MVRLWGSILLHLSSKKKTKKNWPAFQQHDVCCVHNIIFSIILASSLYADLKRSGFHTFYVFACKKTFSKPGIIFSFTVTQYFVLVHHLNSPQRWSLRLQDDRIWKIQHITQKPFILSLLTPQVSCKRKTSQNSQKCCKQTPLMLARK